MSRELTPERVRKLREGATTPGSWFVDSLGRVFSVDTDTDVAVGASSGDADLIAAAPDLARALLEAWEERDQAQAEERAAIVAWLREDPMADYYRRRDPGQIVYAIERGEHRRER